MAATEQSITSTQSLEVAIPADDNENLADGGLADIARADVHLKAEEQTISSQ